MWLIGDSSPVRQGDQKMSLLVEKGRWLASNHDIYSREWPHPKGVLSARQSVPRDLNVRSVTYFAFRLEDRCEGLGRHKND